MLFLTSAAAGFFAVLAWQWRGIAKLYERDRDWWRSRHMDEMDARLERLRAQLRAAGIDEDEVFARGTH